MAKKLTGEELKELRDRFDQCCEAEDQQRRSILAAKKFLALDQWDPAVKTQREGQQAIQGQASQPPRPCLTIDRVSQPVQQVSNAIRAANFSVEFAPNGDGADKTTADLYQGLWRTVMNAARDEAPVEWAATDAAGTGLGWFRMRSDYCDDTTDDQEIVLERVPNNLSVYCDPQAVKVTKADARYMFVTEIIAKDEAQRKYHLTDEDMRGLEEFSSTGDNTREWVTKNTIRVVEYWCIDDESDDLYRHKETGQTAYKSTLPEDQRAKPDDHGYEHRRSIKRPVVQWEKAIATKILEEGTWAGNHIPLIPILGKEVNVDGTPLLFGIVQPAMGPQEMVNYSYSAAIEVAALGNKAPILAPFSAISNYKDIWQNANRFNYAYLPWDPWDDSGRQNPQPMKFQSEAPIQAYAQLLSMSEDAVRVSTAFDPSLGQAGPAQRQASGEMIRALQHQQELGQSHWLDHTSRAVLYAGELFMEAAPKYYDRPGRVVQIAGIDNKPQQVVLGQHFLPAQQPGQPPTPLNQQDPQHAQMIAQGLAQFYDLSKGKYAVTVTVGKGSATRKQEGVEALGVLAQAAPELVPRYADLWVGEMDFPGAQDVAARLKPPDVMGQGLPPQVQAQVQQLMSENQQLKMAIATKQAENFGKLQVAQEDNATRLKIALIGQLGQLAATDAKVDAENTRSLIDAITSRIEGLIGAHKDVIDTLSKKVDHAHELLAAQQAHGHDLALQAQQHAHEETQAARQAATALANSEQPAQNTSPTA